MAYSDYGGFAYRNGNHILEHSDATITPEGDTFGTPGCYPGFAMLATGESAESVKEKIEWPSGHAVLGDGPIYVVLYKQSTVMVYEGPKKLDIKMPYANVDRTKECRLQPIQFSNHILEVIYTSEDNYYVYAKLTQPDNNVWTGFSGYGVGAGFEDGDYGYNNSDREDTLLDLWAENS